MRRLRPSTATVPGVDADGLRTRAGQARTRADRGPADRLRGRLRHAARRRRGRRRARRPAQTLADRPAATPFSGIRFKSFEAAGAPAWHPHPGSVPRRLLGDGPLPPGFVVTLPKVTAVEQVEVDGPTCCERSKPPTACPTARCGSRSRSRPPQAILGRGRHRADRADDRRPRAAAAPGCTTALTTTARGLGVAAAYQ